MTVANVLRRLGARAARLPPGYALKPGYRTRPNAEYFTDSIAGSEGIVHQPDVYPFAAHLAERMGATRLIDIGCGQGHKLAHLMDKFDVLGIDTGENIDSCRSSYPKARWLSRNLERQRFRLRARDLRGAVLICSDVIEHLRNPGRLLSELRASLDHAHAVVLSTPERDLVRGPGDMGPPANPFHVREWNRDELEQLVTTAGIPPAFSGLTVNNDRDLAKRTSLFVIEPERAPLPAPPSTFRVTAILTAYNEADVICDVIRRLVAQGLQVHLIDNWSDDGTFELVQDQLAGSVVSLERFPLQGPSSTYDWRALLERVAEVAAESGADWTIHQDSDEIRSPPWPGVDLRTALYRVGQCGYNAVDHTVLDFRPVDESFAAGDDLEKGFHLFEFGSRPGHFIQIKAWSHRGRVDLSSSGGHEAKFPNRRVFPYKFLIKHYPIRSTTQGHRKIFRDRLPRWNPEERSMGWHVQYDTIDPSNTLLSPSERLVRFDAESFYSEYLVERLSGVGVIRA